jgi:hypothetical protein
MALPGRAQQVMQLRGPNAWCGGWYLSGRRRRQPWRIPWQEACELTTANGTALDITQLPGLQHVQLYGVVCIHAWSRQLGQWYARALRMLRAGLEREWRDVVVVACECT